MPELRRRPLPSLMPKPWWLLVLLLGLPAGPVQAGDWWPFGASPPALVEVAGPYIEWRTGPAAGYPVVHASEQGESLTLLIRRTGWVKVRDRKGREGWVSVADLERSASAGGDGLDLGRSGFDDFRGRRWEGGLMLGDFEGARLLAAYGGYWMTENLAAELWLSQALGSASEILLVNAGIVHQPFPHWRISPYFTLGAGQVFINPKTTLARPDSRDNPSAHAGLGLRMYLADRYFLRAEVREYKIFTERDTNEEAIEWKLGLSVFF